MRVNEWVFVISMALGISRYPWETPPHPLTPTQPSYNYLNVLAGIAREKPRNRSEWEARFAHWQKPASETEELKIEAVAKRIRTALARSKFLSTRSWEIIKQGSYHNNTNVRSESDVDLCVCLTDAFFVDAPQSDWPTNAELGCVPVPFQFDYYRNIIAWCLEQEFGASAVTRGKKALHLHKNDNEKINADIVPAYTLQKFGSRGAAYLPRPVPDNGIALLTTENKRITNFPKQHYLNGCAKNDLTGRRYKRVVRILKRLRIHMAENITLAVKTRQRAKSTASYLIESLVYNCPDTAFGHTYIYDDVAAVLNYLSVGLNDTRNGTTLLTLPVWAFWYEVNGIKPLWMDQAWTLAEAQEFVAAARSYMGL
ncbi:MAG: hypothetical protein ABSD21_04130 [Rhizomicrobium sp.]